MLYAATKGQRVEILIGSQRNKQGVIVTSQPYRTSQGVRYSVRVEVDGQPGLPEYGSEDLAPVHQVQTRRAA
jgi:hypothetical protein